MNRIKEDYIFAYQSTLFISKELVEDQTALFLDLQATLFVATHEKSSFKQLQKLNPDALFDLKDYIQNILESDWKQRYTGKVKKGSREYIETFSFREKGKQVNIDVENGQRPQILNDFLRFLSHFYPDIKAMTSPVH